MSNTPTHILSATSAAAEMFAADPRLVAVTFEYTTAYGQATARITPQDVTHAVAHGLIMDCGHGAGFVNLLTGDCTMCPA